MDDIYFNIVSTHLCAISAFNSHVQGYRISNCAQESVHLCENHKQSTVRGKASCMRDVSAYIFGKGLC
jgi:hypothetical protein